MEEEEAGQLLDRTTFDAMVVEAKGLLPHITVLSGGQMQKATTKSNAYQVQAIPKEKAVEAAMVVYAWLQNENSTIGGGLKFLAKGGLFYTAFANDKLTRAYLSSESVSEQNLMALCVHRPCPVAPEPGACDDGAIDWAALKKPR